MTRENDISPYYHFAKKVILYEDVGRMFLR